MKLAMEARPGALRCAGTVKQRSGLAAAGLATIPARRGMPIRHPSPGGDLRNAKLKLEGAKHDD